MKWKELTKTLVILNWKKPLVAWFIKKNVSAIISLSWSCKSRKGKITLILIDTLDSFETDTRKSVTGQSEGQGRQPSSNIKAYCAWCESVNRYTPSAVLSVMCRAESEGWQCKPMNYHCNSFFYYYMLAMSLKRLMMFSQYDRVSEYCFTCMRQGRGP